MSESLVGRVARLVSGTFTTLVDAAENTAPELVVRQALEEVDSAIGDVRVEIGRKQAARHNANRELSALNDRGESLKAQINTALNENRVDLAESGTDELIGIEDRIPLIEGLIVSTKEEEGELSRYLSGLRSKKEEMQRDLDMIRERAVQGQSTSEDDNVLDSKGSNIDIKVEKAMDAVSRVKSSSTGVPSEKGATDTKARGELEELHRKNRVAERLEALKKES